MEDLTSKSRSVGVSIGGNALRLNGLRNPPSSAQLVVVGLLHPVGALQVGLDVWQRGDARMVGDELGVLGCRCVGAVGMDGWFD
jgi:hypothetical protein